MTLKKTHKAIFTFGVVLAMFAMIAIPSMDNAQAEHANELTVEDYFYYVRDGSHETLFTIGDQHKLSKLVTLIDDVTVQFDSTLFDGTTVTIDNFYDSPFSLDSHFRDLQVMIQHGTEITSSNPSWDGSMSFPADPIDSYSLPDQVKVFHVGDPSGIINLSTTANIVIGTGNADVYIVDRFGVPYQLEECLAENGWMPLGNIGCSNTSDGYTNINTYQLGDFVLTGPNTE